jgi:hypothetical protein
VWRRIFPHQPEQKQFLIIGNSLVPLYGVDQDSLQPLLQWLSQNKTWKYSVKKIDHLLIDFGSLASTKEKKIYFKARGVKFGILVRHLPDLLIKLLKARETSQCPGCVYLLAGAYFAHAGYVISVKTRDALIEVVNELIARHAPEIDAEQRKLIQCLSKQKHWIYSPGCPFCGAARNYAECCGKNSRVN